MTKMDEKTLKALKASIRHWRANVRAIMPDQASVSESDCVLCAQFISNSGCNGCPVKQRTGRMFCQRSPYMAARNAYLRWCGDDSLENRRKWRKQAQAELDFLRSLLPVQP